MNHKCNSNCNRRNCLQYRHRADSKNKGCFSFLGLILIVLMAFSCSTKKPEAQICKAEVSKQDVNEFHQKLVYIPKTIMGDLAFDSYQVINENSYSLYHLSDESTSEEVYVKLSDVKFLCTDQQNSYPREDCYPYEVGMDAIVKYTALKNKLSEQSDKFAEQTKRIEDTLK